MKEAYFGNWIVVKHDYESKGIQFELSPVRHPSEDEVERFLSDLQDANRFAQLQRNRWANEDATPMLPFV